MPTHLLAKLTGFTALLIAAAALAAAPEPISRHSVVGLEQPAEILIDTWGVPHIYANTHYDAFFVQGFNAARDRLWQIDLWRRRGLGQLSEVLGADYVAQDRAARAFLYRGDMYREWLAYGSDAKKIAEAFTAGINAYVEETQTNPTLLPPEFELLGYRPVLWQADDIVRIRSNGLWRNVTTEVQRARIICEHGPTAAARWKQLEPAWQTAVPEGLDPCAIPEDVLDVYQLAKAPVVFAPKPMKLALERATHAAIDESLGSNNWVVAPERTATGRPILADDPHRGHAVPSLRYIAHLHAPGLNVIGAGEPALPGISIGHNERIAFGLTIFPIDQEDLYVYQVGKRGYRYRGRWQPFTEVTETIAVRNADPVAITLRFTRHGPVVWQSKAKAYAVRAAWLDAGMAPYFGSVEYMRASNWRTFNAALNRWGAPAENQVYADIDGNIGYKPAGLFPRRNTWDGLLPVPGDGRYEWDGYFDMDVLPEEVNPSRGYSGTANSMNLPPDYPINDVRIGFEWSSPWRYRRLWEVLATQDVHTLEESLALQRDYRSGLAVDVLRALPKGLDGPGFGLLESWDGRMSADSPAAAFYAVWYYRHLAPAIGELVAPGVGSPDKLIDPLTVLDQLTSADVTPTIATTLADAYQETSYLLGPVPEHWRWGDLHEIRFEHPLQQIATGDLAAQLRLPPYERGGSANTTNNTGFKPSDFLVRSGASFRMVLDVGDWDAAMMTNAPGQSGDPRSPHYQDLLKGWAEEGAFPLLFSREKIEQQTRTRIVLTPRTDRADRADRTNE